MSNYLGQKLDVSQTLQRNDAELCHVSAQGMLERRCPNPELWAEYRVPTPAGSRTF